MKLRNIQITRATPGNEPGQSSLAHAGKALRVTGILPHNATFEPTGATDSAALLLFADQHLKLLPAMKTAIEALLDLLPEPEWRDKAEREAAVKADVALMRFKQLSRSATE